MKPNKTMYCVFMGVLNLRLIILDAASNQRSVDTTLALLQTAFAQSEEESEVHPLN